MEDDPTRMNEEATNESDEDSSVSEDDEGTPLFSLTRVM